MAEQHIKRIIPFHVYELGSPDSRNYQNTPDGIFNGLNTLASRLRIGPDFRDHDASGITYYLLDRRRGKNVNQPGGWFAELEVEDIQEESKLFGKAGKVTVTGIEVYCRDQGKGHGDFRTRVTLNMSDTDVDHPQLQELDNHVRTLDSGLLVAESTGLVRPRCTNRPTNFENDGQRPIGTFEKQGDRLVFSLYFD
jgi:hypothetical protein